MTPPVYKALRWPIVVVLWLDYTVLQVLFFNLSRASQPCSRESYLSSTSGMLSSRFQGLATVCGDQGLSGEHSGTLQHNRQTD